MTATRWLNGNTPFEVGDPNHPRGPGRPPGPAPGFSPVQVETLQFMVEFTDKNNYPPSTREIASARGVTQHAALCVAQILILKGALLRDTHQRSRGAVLTALGRSVAGSPPKPRIVPVMSEKKCPCGTLHFLRETLRCAECQRLGRFPDADRDAVEKTSEP